MSVAKTKGGGQRKNVRGRRKEKGVKEEEYGN
jgi:hypothetical protein